MRIEHLDVDTWNSMFTVLPIITEDHQGFLQFFCCKLIDGIVTCLGRSAFNHRAIITVAIGILNQSFVFFHYFGYIILRLLCNGVE